LHQRSLAAKAANAADANRSASLKKKKDFVVKNYI